ncbi:MAG: MOFRL family protein, partial [Gemmatimonadaceae bacterium]
DQPSVIGSGPCSPDPMSEAEFLAMLDAYNLRDKVPRELAVALGLQGSAEDTVLPPHPGDAAFDLVNYSIVARNQDACRAMVERARAFGIEDITLVEAPLSGEAETLGHTIASIAVRSAANDAREQLIIWGGEPTVSMNVSSHGDFDDSQYEDEDNDDSFEPELVILGGIRENRVGDEEEVLAPMGGRMQALALSAALALEAEMMRHGRDADVFRASILAAGTDGRDGPTDACGAIIDAMSPLAAREHGRDPIKDLQWFRSYHSLDAAQALLKTGPTGTNVMDVVAVYIAPVTSND